jgi:uncharacterized protein
MAAMKRKNLASWAVAAVVVGAVVAWKLGFFSGVDDSGNCADVVAVFGANPKHAAAVCLRQAKEGDAIAETDIGKMYAEGRGVEADFDQALMWFNKAAAQNQPDGLYNLALMYANGDGVKQDWAAAIKWYRMAADRGQSDAQNSLGLRYERGEGLGKDLIQAYKWFALSLDHTNRPADRAMAIANRDRVAKLMSSEQIADAQNQIRAWKPVSP